MDTQPDHLSDEAAKQRSDFEHVQDELMSDAQKEAQKYLDDTNAEHREMGEWPELCYAADFGCEPEELRALALLVTGKFKEAQDFTLQRLTARETEKRVYGRQYEM